MKINTYAVNCNDAWLNTDGDDISGSYVKYKDHQAVVAELEAKCAALAVENAGMKVDVPMGAIENGRAFAERLEAYPFECQGGDLNMCSDWQELRRCFDHISEWAMHSQQETPATDAYLAEVRAQGVEMFGQYHNFSQKLLIQKEAKKFAAQLRQEAAQ